MLASAFDSEAEPKMKYAIRPTLRQSNNMTRMEVIETVAEVVGDRARVDLEDYDRLVLVEVYRVSYIDQTAWGCLNEGIASFRLMVRIECPWDERRWARI